MVGGWQSTPKGRLVSPEQARWVKTVNILYREAKPLQDKTVGSMSWGGTQKLVLWHDVGSLSTGSPIGSLESTSLIELNVQSGHCNPRIPSRGEQCSCDRVNWKLKLGKHGRSNAIQNWKIKLNQHLLISWLRILFYHWPGRTSSSGCAQISYCKDMHQ